MKGEDEELEEKLRRSEAAASVLRLPSSSSDVLSRLFSVEKWRSG